MDYCSSQILQYLSLPENREGVILQSIVAYVKRPKPEVNRILYQLKGQGRIKHLSGVPPVWQSASLPCQASLPPQPPPLPSQTPLPSVPSPPSLSPPPSTGGNLLLPHSTILPLTIIDSGDDKLKEAIVAASPCHLHVSGESEHATAVAAAATLAHAFEDSVANLGNCSITPSAAFQRHRSVSGEVETQAHSRPHLGTCGSSSDFGGATASLPPFSLDDGFDANTSRTLAPLAAMSLDDRTGSPLTAASSGSPLGGAACTALLPRLHSDGCIASSAICLSADIKPCSDGEVRTRILCLLPKANESPVKSSHISKTLNITSQVTSRVLYSLMSEGLVTKVVDSPPSWALKDGTSAKEQILVTPSRAAAAVSVGEGKTREDYKKKRNNVIPANALPKLTEFTRAVAMISSRVTQGTGFRVGQSYLMTAAHVVREIIGDMDPIGKPFLNKNKLSDRSVYAEFHHDEAQSASKRYHFVKWFLLDDDLDIALLQFNKDAVSDPVFPSSLECRYIVPDNKERVFLIGYNNGKELKLDISGHIHRPRFDELDMAFFKEAYEKQQHLIFYVRTQLQHGSSGAPLFICRSDTFHLVGVHLRSYPSHEIMSEQADRGNRLRNFQAGVSNNSIRRWVGSLSQDIAKEIFENVNST